VDPVMPHGWLPHIKSRPSARSKAGRHYIAANDEVIENVGERPVPFVTHTGLKTGIVFQDAEVGRCLISVDKLSEGGSEVILNKTDPRIILKNKEVIPLKRKHGVFILDMWIQVPDDGGEDVKEGANPARRT
jgi:hypothetical protein